MCTIYAQWDSHTWTPYWTSTNKTLLGNPVTTGVCVTVTVTVCVTDTGKGKHNTMNNSYSWVVVCNTGLTPLCLSVRQLSNISVWSDNLPRHNTMTSTHNSCMYCRPITCGDIMSKHLIPAGQCMACTSNRNNQKNLSNVAYESMFTRITDGSGTRWAGRVWKETRGGGGTWGSRAWGCIGDWLIYIPE